MHDTHYNTTSYLSYGSTIVLKHIANLPSVADHHPIMAPQFTISCSRAVMATPAILLFAATCVAQFISSMHGDNVVNHYNNNSMIRGSSAHATVVGSSSLATSDENYDDVEVNHHHGHKHHFPPDRKKKSHHDKNHDDSDNSFDFYVFSSK